MSKINSADDVYAFVKQLQLRAQKKELQQILRQLDDALNFGGFGLEIIGAIRTVLVEQQALIRQLMPKEEIAEVVAFVDKAYGR